MGEIVGTVVLYEGESIKKPGLKFKKKKLIKDIRKNSSGKI